MPASRWGNLGRNFEFGVRRGLLFGSDPGTTNPSEAPFLIRSWGSEQGEPHPYRWSWVSAEPGCERTLKFTAVGNSRFLKASGVSADTAHRIIDEAQQWKVCPAPAIEYWDSRCREDSTLVRTESQADPRRMLPMKFKWQKEARGGYLVLQQQLLFYANASGNIADVFFPCDSSCQISGD